jgi:hypothetical protein
MSDALDRRASLGVAAVVLTLGLVVGVAFLSSSSDEPQTSAPPIADLDGDNPLPGGTQMSLAQAADTFPVPLYRPDTSMASDSSVSEAWVRVEASPEVWIQYRSGMVVLVRPLGDLQQTQEYAAAQIPDGVPGRVISIKGVEAFLVPQTEAGSGSVRLVIDGTVVTIVGYIGDFSDEQLTNAAVSVLATSDQVAAGSQI